MVYKIFTTIVFIAEIIIAYTLLSRLFIFDKLILKADENLTAMKPSLADCGQIIRKISAQCVEFSEDLVSDFKMKRDEIALKQLNKLLVAILLLRLNSKFINKLRRSKLIKRIGRGLSLLQLMV